MLGPSEQLRRLSQGVVEIIKEDELLGKLERSAREGRPLRVKQGFDPSAPDLHLGHAIGLRKLREFQDLGHVAVVIIGDYTGMVGDPSERSETRPRLSYDEVLRNAQTYQAQLHKIVDSARTEVVMNGGWFRSMTFADVMELAAKYTVARILERDDFTERFQAQRPISIHELFYPLMQGYDSVAIRADVELGATEQKFNCLVAREVQKAYGVEPEVVMLMPVLEGTDGVRRMSKSTGNYIGLAEPPREIYGKTMSIPDALILRYFELAACAGPGELAAVRAGLSGGTANPRDLKRDLARRIVTLYHGEAAAVAAEEEFDRIFAKGGVPDEVPEPTLSLTGQRDLAKVWVVALLTGAGMVASGGEARRLIAQGGVRVDGEPVADAEGTVDLTAPRLLQVGKRRFARILPGNVRLEG